MDIIFERYLERLKRRGRNGSTVSNYTLAVRAFERFCAENELEPAKATTDDVETWVQDSAAVYAPTTRKTNYANIRAAYRYAHQDGLIPRFPFLDVEAPALPDTRPRIIPVEKLREIKGNCVGDRAWTMFHLFAYTGMRLFEVQKATWEDVEETSAGWTLEVIGKFGKRRYVPIHPALQDVLGERYEGPLLPGFQGEQIAQTTMYETLKEIGGNGFGFHDFRRTVATSLRKNKADRELVLQILGWAKTEIFDKFYYHIDHEALHRAMLTLYADDPL